MRFTRCRTLRECCRAMFSKTSFFTMFPATRFFCRELILHSWSRIVQKQRVLRGRAFSAPCSRTAEHVNVKENMHIYNVFCVLLTKRKKHDNHRFETNDGKTYSIRSSRTKRIWRRHRRASKLSAFRRILVHVHRLSSTFTSFPFICQTGLRERRSRSKKQSISDPVNWAKIDHKIYIFWCIFWGSI